MNAELVLPLERMTVLEKIEVIDMIMEDLSKDPDAVPEIEWHGEILRQRAEDLANGRDRLFTLDEAEVRIRELTGRK